MYVLTKNTNQNIKSPLNYIGGKSKILKQILPLFPKNIKNFIDLFAGGCNVGINVNAEKIICNDNLTYLIDMYNVFQNNDLDSTMYHIENRIKEFGLSLINEDGYKKMRDYYNKYKYPLDLFVLIAYSFNHQIRFNNSHQFNNPFGKDRSNFNQSMKYNLEQFIIRIKELNITFSNDCFQKFNYTFLSNEDFVYCDPPYLITTGTYNDGKRGFKGWNEIEELHLLNTLTNLNNHNIKFALSNVLEHKGKSNEILKSWLSKNNFYVNHIDFNYSNSNYQTIDRSLDTEAFKYNNINLKLCLN